MTRKKSILSLLGAAALTMSLAACGGDDNGNEEAPGITPMSERDDEDDAAEDDATEDQATDDDVDDATEDQATDNEASGAGGDYCSEVEAMGLAMMNPPDPTDGEAVGNAGDTFKAIADIAPDDIKADWQAMADAFDLIAEIDYTDPDSIAALEQLDVEVSADRITDHLMSECGVS
jgi:hypothetical protein